MKIKLVKHFSIFAIIGLTTGCGPIPPTLASLNNYSVNTQEILLATTPLPPGLTFSSPLPSPHSELQLGLNSYDWKLYTAELGRVQQMQEQFSNSLNSYAKVIQAEKTDLLLPQKPDIQNILTSVYQTTSNIYATSYTIKPYVLPPYAITLLYQYQGLNYLLTKNLQGAVDNFRELAKWNSYFAKKYHPIPPAPSKFTAISGLPDYDKLLNISLKPTTLDSSLDNGLVDFIASLTFLKNGDMQEALSTAREAVERTPYQSLFKSYELQMMQLTHQSTTSIRSTAQRYGVPVPQALRSDKARVWVMIEEGFVPELQQKNYSIVYNKNLYYYSLPYYTQTPFNSFTPWIISTQNTQTLSSPALSITDLKAQALRELYPSMILLSEYLERQMIQVGQEAQEMANAAQSWGSVIADIADINNVLTNFFPDPLDLRYWSLLPANVELGMLELPAGSHTLTIEEQHAAMNQNWAVKQVSDNPLVATKIKLSCPIVLHGGEKAAPIKLTCPITLQARENALLWVNAQTDTPFCKQVL